MISGAWLAYAIIGTVIVAVILLRDPACKHAGTQSFIAVLFPVAMVVFGALVLGWLSVCIGEYSHQREFCGDARIVFDAEHQAYCNTGVGMAPIPDY